MAATSPLIPRAGSYSSLAHLAHASPCALVPRPCVVVHQTVQHLINQDRAPGMRRSTSAPCLNKASRFVVAQTSDGAEDEHAAGTSSGLCQEHMQQQEQLLRAKPKINAGLAGESRFASLSRVLLVSQPSNIFRNLANRKWPSAVGPISLLVFLFGTVLALLAAVRSVLIRKVKACKSCKGFGVVRCRLCDGRGSVDWRAKFSYSEMCPLCAAKRFVVCPDCGGHYHRRLFSHVKTASPAVGAASGGEQFAVEGGPLGSIQRD